MLVVDAFRKTIGAAWALPTRAETQPIAGCLFFALSPSLPNTTANPEAFGTTWYHSGAFRSSTTLVMGGLAEYRLTRTLRTSPRLVVNPRNPVPGMLLGI